MATTTPWELPGKQPGRFYYHHHDLIERYPDVRPLVERMAPTIRQFVQVESAVRLVLDSEAVNPVTADISVPFEGDNEHIYKNMGELVFEQCWGYYLSANSKATHHGLTNLVFDGQDTSLIRREMEKFLSLAAYRTDVAARLMRGYKMQLECEPINRDVYMKPTLSKVLDISFGVRMFSFGENINRVTIFLPIPGGEEAKDRLYYNIEHIIHQNLVTYDEVHSQYLPVSEPLLYRELESLLRRARKKMNSRKKMLNGLKMHTVLLEDPSMIHHESIADLYYDKINRVDLMDESSSRSRDLVNSHLIQSAEIATTVADVNSLTMQEPMYIDREHAVGLAKAAAPRRPVPVTRQAMQSASEAEPAAAPQPQPAPVGAGGAADGLDEL